MKKKKKKYDYSKIGASTRRQAKESAKRKGVGGTSIFKSEVNFTKFIPSVDEDHTADIVPFQAGPNMPLDLEKNRPMVPEGEWAYTYEYWQHRGLGPLNNERVICPERTYKRPCPVCEHRRELVAEKAFDGDKMQEMLCKRRNLYNIVCYDTDVEEKKGCQLLDVAWVYFEKHISKLANKTVRRKRGAKLRKADPYKNMGDPSANGVTVEWSIEGAKSKKDFDTWMSHQLIERDYDLDEDVLDAALQLDQIVEVKSYKEIYELYYDEPYEGDEDEGEEEEEEEEEMRSYEEGEDTLEDLTRKELKALIKEESLGVRVTTRMSDEDIRDAIREAYAAQEVEEEVEEEEEEEEAPEEDAHKIRRGGRRGRQKTAPKGKQAKAASKKQTCPAGGVFGADFEQFDECDECEKWNPCETLFQDEYAEEEG